MTPQRHLNANWFVDARLKLRHLQLLEAFARSSTLQDAAASIGISQPAASKLLHDLEDMIGVPLLEQVGRKVRYNTFGSILTERATAILKELDRARDSINAVLDGHSGRVSIGAIDGPAVDYVTQALIILQAEYPQIDLEISTGSSASLFRELKSGTIDIMIGRPDEDMSPSAYEYDPIGREPMVLAARCDHPLAQGGPHALATLLHYPWILQRRGGRSRLRLEQLFRDAHLSLPRFVIGSDSLVITLSYIAQTDALTILSEPVARHQASFGQIAFIPNGLDLSISTYGLILSRERPLTFVAARVLTVLRQTMR